MWALGITIVGGLLAIWCSHWIKKWRNPKCNGVLPPGSMGLPLVGETLQYLFVTNKSLDLHPFFKKRIKRYGPVFRTSLLGRPVVVSADAEINHYIFLQEGRSVELWYLQSFAKIFTLDGDSRLSAAGAVHKYIRSIALNHFGVESLKKMVPEIEERINKTLQKRSIHESFEIKHCISHMAFSLTSKILFSFDAENLSDKKLVDDLTEIADGILSIPLNIPGTRFHKCLKDAGKVLKLLRDEVQRRRSSSETSRGDLLDQAIADTNKEDKESFVKDDFIVPLTFAFLFASIESISTTSTLALKLLSEHPSALKELTAEHERIVMNRSQNSDGFLTWDEYKSMTFTRQVINETLRLGNPATELIRKATKDIHVKGYTIPAGWIIMANIVNPQLNPEIYKDPHAFNPWRWKDLDPIDVSKHFTPFGGGSRQCVGAEFAKLFISSFFHVLLTKYHWKMIKAGRIIRTPIMHFKDGVHIKVLPKPLS